MVTPMLHANMSSLYCFFLLIVIDKKSLVTESCIIY